MAIDKNTLLHEIVYTYIIPRKTYMGKSIFITEKIYKNKNQKGELKMFKNKKMKVVAMMLSGVIALSVMGGCGKSADKD